MKNIHRQNNFSIWCMLMPTFLSLIDPQVLWLIIYSRTIMILKIAFTPRILQTDISDHYIVFHLSESDIINSQKNEYNLVRIANADRMAQYVQSIQNTDWTFLDTYQHCQYYFSKFLTKLKNIYDESFPLVRVKMQYRDRLPWLSKGMNESIKLKNKLYGISLQHPTF